MNRCFECGEAVEEGSFHDLIAQVDCDGCNMDAHVALLAAATKIERDLADANYWREEWCKLAQEGSDTVKLLREHATNLGTRCKEDLDSMQTAFDKLYIEKCQAVADRDEHALAYQNTLRTWHNTIRLLAESQKAFDAVRHILDEHICTGRENKKLSDRRLVQRGIDAVDALQQFRMRAFGSLLPNDDGVYQISDLNGKIYAEAPTSAEAEKAFADLNKKYKVVDGQLFEV